MIRRHGGCVVKTVGDAVMAAFRDPAEAVRAALAIHDDTETFNPPPPLIRTVAQKLPAGTSR